MSDPIEYTYYKKSIFRGDPAQSVVRHQSWRDYEFWDGIKWKSLCDNFAWMEREDDYWEISESEALAELPRLTVRYAELRREQQAEIERKERRKIENERMGRTLRCLEGQWTALEKAAIAVHDLYKSLVDAGFTDDQALKIVAQVVAYSGNNGQPPPIQIPSLN